MPLGGGKEIKMERILKFLSITISLIFSISLCISADETQYAKVDNAFRDDYVIWQGDSMEVEQENNVEFTGSVTEDAPSWEYEFTTPRDGRYVIIISDLLEGTSVSAYTIDAWDNARKFYDSTTISAKKNEKYTIRITQSSGNTSFSLFIGIQQPTIDISENITTVTDTINYYKQKNAYSYTAPVDGVYYINFECEPANEEILSSIYYKGDKIASEGISRNTQGYQITFDKGETYHFFVEQSDGRGPYSIKIGVPQPIVDITGYTEVIDKFEYDDQVNTYMFTAPCSGTYVFNNEDYEINLVVYRVNDAGKDDIIGETSRPFADTVQELTLTEGESYRIVVYIPWYTSATDYSFTISYPVEAQQFLNKF